MAEIKNKPLAKQIKKQLIESQKQAINATSNAESHIDKHLFRRFHKLRNVKRFLSFWILTVGIIILGLFWQIFAQFNYYQKLEPVPGGIYNEGLLGNFTNLNPIFANNKVDSSLSRLIFGSLITFDNNNKISYELASSMKVNSTGTSYSLTLRPNLKWQDGKPLTAADVLFTFRLIQNPDVNSPLRSYFDGVSFSAKGNVITFNIPNPLASFPDYLNVGILPQHILSTVPVSELRSSNFNTQNPIGSGPFEFKSLAVKGSDPSNAEVQINLAPYKNYALGEPKLNAFIVHAYASVNQLEKALLSGSLNGADGISVPSSKIVKNKSFKENSLILTAGSYVFFRTSNSVLSNQKVRSALEQAVNTNKIISSLGYKTSEVVSPFLKNQVEYNPQYAQAQFNKDAANTILTQDGWIMGSNGIRSKNGQELKFNLTIPNIEEYVNVANLIKSDWATIGAQADILALDVQDFPSALNYHQYDAVLYGISIGADPDVYAYWNSEMFNPATSRWTNLSEYKNKDADASLSAGRTRLDPVLRRVKYAPFLAAWQADVPAVGLYQPRDLYITNGTVFGLTTSNINSSADRYNNVNNWEIVEAKVTEK